MPRNAFYAQSGGVTAVINASAAGVLEAARANSQIIGKVYAGRNGIIGALTEDLIDTSLESDATIAALRHTPGGAFGSCRYKLKPYEQSPAEYEHLIKVFKAQDSGYFFDNGGGKCYIVSVGDYGDTLAIADLTAGGGALLPWPNSSYTWLETQDELFATTVSSTLSVTMSIIEEFDREL